MSTTVQPLPSSAPVKTENTMKAIVQEEYGSPDVLELRDVERPAVGDDEALVRIRAAAANPFDWHMVRGVPYFMRAQTGLRRPRNKVPGGDVAGEVEAVGKDVTSLRPGDEVYGFVRVGGFAEYVSVPEGVVGRKPSNLTFEQAAGVPLAGYTALQGLRDLTPVEPGQKVLIVGAGGGVGTFAVQLAKHFGAEVTGVCSTPNVEMVRSLGADHVIDYTREDFIQGERRYDLIFELAGMRSPSDQRRALTREGTLVLSSGESNGRWIGPVSRILKAVATSPFVSQKLVALNSKRSREDLDLLTELIEAGKLSPVIDRAYQLSETPDAIRYVEEGHARGKVVIMVSR